ncbi:lipin/Ned1/Smp2 family protein [Pleionea sp. CnH1-48]|uniref:lipin/Ned1/Smp2 family protein n=1 Tax=Pleionea sp. CnH1-48 TaxID=2954494 RepID=UPI0020969037|nr:haloacid dehalogenase [Pleionea sp. CnH1-48]MCO7223887.1 haloacid dehalogenase [Pleionea sp. CnH1-48]
MTVFQSRSIKKLAALVLGITLVGTASAQQCTDYSAALNPPSLQGPAKKKFRHWGNRWLSWTAAPFHMVHDQIVAKNQAATFVGKFDYGQVIHKDLEGEDVHVYIHGASIQGWEYLGEYRTNSDGKIYVPVGVRPTGEYRVRMVVEGDLSSADGFLTVVNPNRETVLFDIDGTLTLSDFEGVGDYLGTDTADPHAYAKQTVEAYVAKGYQVIYLTGRSYWQAKTTRRWLGDVMGLNQWHLRTNPNGSEPFPSNTEQYKRDYIKNLINNVGLEIIRAYGNASTDISSYRDAGIPASDTYIIGENAGNSGTNDLGGDYSHHYFNVVLPTANAYCGQ